MPTNGNDFIRFSTGDADIDGLWGDDRFRFEDTDRPSIDPVFIQGGDGRDILDLSAASLGSVALGDGATGAPSYIIRSEGTGGLATLTGGGGLVRFDDIEVIRVNANDYVTFYLGGLDHGVTLYGGQVGNNFNGSVAHPDRFFGGAGNDSFRLGVGDVAYGFGGNDSFSVVGGLRFDLSGGEGYDTLYVTNATRLDLALGTMVNGGVTNRVSGIEAVDINVQDGYRADVFGTADTDRLIQSRNYADSTGTVAFWGRGGDDVLTGRGYLHGGEGNDVIRLLATGRAFGGNGDDVIYDGDSYQAFINAGAGNDLVILTSYWLGTVRAGTGNDVFRLGETEGFYATMRGGDIFLDGNDVLDLSYVVTSYSNTNPVLQFDVTVADVVYQPGQQPDSMSAGSLLISPTADGAWLVSGYTDLSGESATFYFTVHAPEGWWIDGLIL